MLEDGGRGGGSITVKSARDGKNARVATNKVISRHKYTTPLPTTTRPLKPLIHSH